MQKQSVYITFLITLIPAAMLAAPHANIINPNSLWGKTVSLEERVQVNEHKVSGRPCATFWEADRPSISRNRKGQGIPDWRHLRWQEPIAVVRYEFGRRRDAYQERCMRNTRIPYIALRRQLILGGPAWKAAILFESPEDSVGVSPGLKEILIQSPRLKKWKKVEAVRDLFMNKYGFASPKQGVRTRDERITRYRWRKGRTEIHMKIRYLVNDMNFMIRVSYAPIDES